MNKECLNKGACIKCGCRTTELQMCNKACNDNCYPRILSKKEWKFITTYSFIILEDNIKFKIENNKFLKF
ncbi:MAG: hypothetical protein ACRC03_19260 [Romboutsia sp.]